MRERDIVHENARYFVLRAEKGWDVYKRGDAYATRCGIFGRGPEYLARAIAYAEQRAQADSLAAQ